MRLHKFFITQKLNENVGKEIFITDSELIHQWQKVFRFSSGERIILLDNSGFEYLSEITLLTKKEAKVSIIESKENKNIPSKKLWVIQSLIKKDNFEWVIEKCTEVGVSDFVPLISDRSEKKDINMERARKIIKEASEQSGRGFMPELHEIIKIDDIVKYKIPIVAFHLEGEQFKKEDFEGNQEMIILIGPEGGWTEREIELFKNNNVKIVCLGNCVLRAETAAIVSSALLLL
ncbi:MAG: RsmE family RNA methyltransferase [Candidatus Paceibacterota bacterium]